MILSIWRYSHFALALSSSVFLLIASATGVILALEPITEQLDAHPQIDLESLSLGKAIEQIQPSFETLVELEVDPQDQILVRGVNTAGLQGAFYVNPINGEILGQPKPQAGIYSFMTNLHRSLFLKGIGRFIAGLVSLLLILIGVSGVVLVAKHQGGVKQILSPIVSKNFMRRYHVSLGRLLLIPIMIIAATGVYLSAVQFSLINGKVQMPDYPDSIDEAMTGPGLKAPFFRETTLEDIRSLQFPFSEFPEDAYEFALKDRSVLVHQYTGEIISAQSFPFSLIMSQVSMDLHTGRGNIWWSVVLLITSTSLLFFMYSGFKMTIKRRKSRFKVRTFLPADQAEFILLVGSETGKTLNLAQTIAAALTEAGMNVHLGPLNSYQLYPRAEQLLVITSTYGDGDAPATASRFKDRFDATKPLQDLRYCVLSLGSLNYPAYCQFGIEVDALLQAHPKFTPTIPITKINKQDPKALAEWGSEWSEALQLEWDWKPPKNQSPAFVPFKIEEKSPMHNNTFMLEIRVPSDQKCQSGDLLEVVPAEGKAARFYSIGIVDQRIVLSIKKHEHGLCSNYLHGQENGSTIQARINKQAHFRLPDGDAPLIMIANGTGMAPFLGMLFENQIEGRIHLFWGGRDQEAWEAFKKYCERAEATTPMASKHLIYSRHGEESGYVQDLLPKHQGVIKEAIAKGGTIMICGSMAMRNSIFQTFAKMSKNNPELKLDALEEQDRLRTDCY